MVSQAVDHRIWIQDFPVEKAWPLSLAYHHHLQLARLDDSAEVVSAFLKTTSYSSCRTSRGTTNFLCFMAIL